MPITPAVTYSKPMNEGRRAGSIASDWSRRYTTQYRARSNHPTIGPMGILAACPIPIGAYYAEGDVATGTARFDLGAWAQEIYAEPSSNDGLDWLVRVEYGPGEPPLENPLDRVPEISWDFVSREEIVDEDEAGNPVVNSAFDYFDPPITRDNKLMVVQIRRNQATFDYEQASDYQDALNATDFMFPGDALKWKITKYTGGGAQAKISLFSGTVDVTYWPVFYELNYSRNGWERPILDQGMRQLNTAGDGWEPILIRGQPISSPALLDGSGYLLTPDHSPEYREFQLYKVRDFAALGFSGLDFGKGPIP